MVYESGIKSVNEDMGSAYWFLFYQDKLLVSINEVTFRNQIPFIKNIEGIFPSLSDIQYLGHVDGKESYIASLSEEIVDGDYIYKGLRNLFGDLEDDWYWLANRAYHLNNWKKKNRFCGSCGDAMHPSDTEIAMKCNRCGNIIYPRISPAVIVAITRGEHILLARSARFTQVMYSVIAGFVEPGETLEECVMREVKEEVGVKVKNVRYFGSQPWPYPDSIMIAFTAEHAGGDICIDNNEIVDAGWYTKDNLPEIPSRLSVARKLIDWFCSI